MFEDRIARGMDLLDKYYENKSWVFEIDTSELKLASACWCVLGQLRGFDSMLDELELFSDVDDNPQSASYYGFDFPGCYAHAVELRQMAVDPEVEKLSLRRQRLTDLVWHQLDVEWIAAIKKRIDEGIEL